MRIPEGEKSKGFYTDLPSRFFRAEVGFEL
jgi:hypothetical protein